VVVGLVLGMATNVVAARLWRAQIKTDNNRVEVGGLLAVIPIIFAVTFLAAYLPARRVSRIDPMQALRHE
jgi:ABC-type antimicrobial peptide transport system permease subunit